MSQGTDHTGRFVRRFDRYHRISHGLLMASFLGLAGTGLPLIFSDERWARWVSRAWGGFESAAFLHRTFALVLIGVFIAHVTRLIKRVYVHKDYSIFWGPTSMVPQPQDLFDMFAHFRWFVGLGPRPRFDHFTYWEKFDYWAVFWGMLVIGGSGLLLWFPTAFARVLPGWVFNIAMVIHGEEALLAVGFIFTIHFFNGHIRPEKFPMDTVIFTGRMPHHELVEERPSELERLERLRHLEPLIVDPPSEHLLVFGKTIGTIAVVVGLTIVGLILFGVLT
jgi:cytochrome b subunit of formate dehydrogenase